MAAINLIQAILPTSFNNVVLSWPQPPTEPPLSLCLGKASKEINHHAELYPNVPSGKQFVKSLL